MLTLLGTGDRVDEERIAELAADPWQLLGQLTIAGQFNGWDADADFRSRRTRQQRDGMEISRRRYYRLVRQSIRTRDAAKRMGRQILLRQLLLVAHTGLTPTISFDEFQADPDAAAFVAYWTAMRKRRREFSLAGRDNPFDLIAKILFERCERRGPATDWWMIARARPVPEYVARLADDKRGELLGQWSTYMAVAAGLLKELHAAWGTREIPPSMDDSVWAHRPDLMPSRADRGARTVPAVDLETMVTNAGVDSSTWNQVAAAYNAARDGWINTLEACGALGLLQVACPGKAMRLMAGDLQAYHLASGGPAAHPATRVWARLPLPWQVLSGEAECPASYVEEVCAGFGIDAQLTGWTGPRLPAGQVAAFKPTPELVHGIVVRDPLWAGLLRRAGLWSGKPAAAAAGELHAAYRRDQVGAG
jgi:hypothetical protein